MQWGKLERTLKQQFSPLDVFHRKTEERRIGTQAGAGLGEGNPVKEVEETQAPPLFSPGTL